MDSIVTQNDLIVGGVLAINSLLTAVVGWIGKRFVDSVRELEKDHNGFKIKTHSRLSVLEAKQVPPIYNAEVSP